jgi:phosphoribosylformylglycinamidine synthase
MALSTSDARLITEQLGRTPTSTERVLFENLWSEHCAYRSSRELLGEFNSEGAQVIIGPGDDAAVVDPSGAEWYLTLGIESHNHPSFVDPVDGAATGVGGIVRDTLSMGAYPIALVDDLFVGPLDNPQNRYLLDGIISGIAGYGNAIGVPTVGGSVELHPGYTGNPLVNVGCVGLVHRDAMVTAAAHREGDALVLVGSATGRDGLGGAAFASEDLDAAAAVEDRPAVQVGDPYTEKLLIECNTALIETGVVHAARDLGAAGLGGATAEMVAKAGTGAIINLDAVPQREPQMRPGEILLAESQERMCYAVDPGDVKTVLELADRFELKAAVIGTVTEGNYRCRFGEDTVVDVPAALLADGAPAETHPREPSVEPTSAVEEVPLEEAIERMLTDTRVGSRRWVYRQYDHEVGLRTCVPPGGDAAVLRIPELGSQVAVASGANPRWTTAAPRDGAMASTLEVAANLAVVGAQPLAAVDCLNAGNPTDPAVYDATVEMIGGVARMCHELEVPVVGGNVSLFNQSAEGAIPPTPTILMVGTDAMRRPPGVHAEGAGKLALVGGRAGGLGGSLHADVLGGGGRFPALPEGPKAQLAAIADLARSDHVTAIHDVGDGGLLVTILELLEPHIGGSVELPSQDVLFTEAPARVVVETVDMPALQREFGDRVPVEAIGHTEVGGPVRITAGAEAVTIDPARREAVHSRLTDRLA